MLESLPVALVIAAALGFLTGLGVGGGSLLILWLTAVLHWEPEAARGMNLLFFLPSALISCYFRHKEGLLHPKKLLPGILAGCLAAAITAWLSRGLDTALLKKLFGGLLLITGARELFYRRRPDQRFR